MGCLICKHCGAEIQRGKSFYKHLGEVFCCKKCFNDHLWHGRDEVYYCDEVDSTYIDCYNMEYDYYYMLQSKHKVA